MGAGIGLVLVIMLVGSADQIERKATVKVLPDAEGNRKSLGTSGPVILHLDIDGVIGATSLRDETIATLLTESREGVLKGDRVKAILLRINSPGGGAFESKSIYDSLKLYKERYKVPIIAYVDGLCASGGYMIAVAADKIVANDGSLIGSVGVTTPPFFNVSELIDKYGIKSMTLTRGKDKDALNPFRPWKPDETANFQTLIDYTYHIFIDLVTTNRPQMNKEKLMSDYGAQVYAANTAVELGYIDAAGYLPNSALALAVEAAKIGEEEYHVVQLSTKAMLWDLFGDDRMSLFRGKVTHQFQLHPDLPPELTNKLLYLYLPGY